MSTRRALVAAVLVALALFLAAGLAPRATEGGADGSSLSHGSRGWLVARLYLEARGTSARLQDVEMSASPARGVLVTTFPWQRFAGSEELQALDNFVARGGTLLLGYSGDHAPSDETRVFRQLGLTWHEPRGKPPLHPLRWRRFTSETWSLAGAAEGTRPVVVRAPNRLPDAPAGGSIWYRSATGKPAVFAFDRGRGRVVVLPAEALSNAGLGQPGNADLLERLRGELGRQWSFDEFHHGLVAPASTGSGPQWVLDLYLFHLLFLYLLAAWALVRRFGTPWSEAATLSSSARGFLISLGALHDRLGHHPEAAARLVERAREFDPRLRFSSEETPLDRHAFLALARRLGRLQTRRETTP
jgi:Domain of unknown function (DUF4350)